MDQAGLIHNVFDFVALEMTDQVPVQRFLDFFYFAAHFLYFILTEILRAGFHDFTDQLHRFCFADCNQQNIFSGASCALAGSLDTGFDFHQIFFYHDISSCRFL